MKIEILKGYKAIDEVIFNIGMIAIKEASINKGWCAVVWEKNLYGQRKPFYAFNFQKIGAVKLGEVYSEGHYEFGTIGKVVAIVYSYQFSI